MTALWFRESGTSARPSSGFALGWLAGFLFGAISFFWLSDIADTPRALSLLAWLLLSAYLGLYFGAWAWFVRRLRPGPEQLRSSLQTIRIALLGSLAWTGLEWLRSTLFGGFSWNGLGIALHENLPLIQVADLVGAIGLSFLPLYTALILALVAWRIREEVREQRFRPHLDFASAVLLVLGVFFYGLDRLNSASPEGRLRVEALLLQQNIPQEEKWDPEQAQEIYQGWINLLGEASLALETQRESALRSALTATGQTTYLIPHTDLVILPESAVAQPIGLQPNPQWLDLMHETFQEGNFTLLTGINRLPDPDHYYNSLLATRGAEQARAVYDKRHLVPFGEYFPGSTWCPPIAWMEEKILFGHFASGSKDQAPLAPGNQAFDLLPLICFEDTVAPLARTSLRTDRPQILVNVTNDAWFRESSASWQHFVNAKFRCIEVRRPMFRTANTGVSGAIDEWGSVFSRFEESSREQILREQKTGRTFTRGWLQASLWPARQPGLTPYARWGDWFGLSAFLFLALSVLLPWLRQPDRFKIFSRKIDQQSKKPGAKS